MRVPDWNNGAFTSRRIFSISASGSVACHCPVRPGIPPENEFLATRRLLSRCAKKSPRIKSLETTHALLSGSIAACFRKIVACAATIFAPSFRQVGDDLLHVSPRNLHAEMDDVSPRVARASHFSGALRS